MTAVYYKQLGRYNWAGNEKSWCVSLRTDAGNISATWDEDEEPDTENLLPSEILDLIEAKVDSYWVYTGRERDKAKIAEIREHEQRLDTEWLNDRIKQKKGELERLEKRLMYLNEE